MLKKIVKNLAYILIGLALAIAGGVVYAVNVTVPQATQKGDLPTGLTTGNYQLLHPGSDGLVLTASSTSSNGLAWQTASSTGGTGISSLNGLVGTTQTFATGTDANITLTVVSSGSTHTFTPGFTGQLSVSRGGTGTNTLASLTVGTGLSITGGQNVLVGTSTQISLGTSVVTTLATGTSGTIFNGSIGSNTLTLNLPFASGSNTGQLQAADWTTFNNKLTTVSVDSPLGGSGTSGSHLTCATCVTNVTASGVLSSSGGTTPAITFTGVLPIASGGTATTSLGNLTLTSSNLSFGSGDGKIVLVGTSTNITLTDTPSFTTVVTTATGTFNTLVVSKATTTINGLSYYWPTSVSGTKILQNDGSGNLSWVADQSGGGGSVSGGTTGFVATWASSTSLTTGILLDNGTVAGANATSSTVVFNVQGSGTRSPLNVASSSGTSILRVTDLGNVGIGTTTPGQPLVVVGSTTLTSLTAGVVQSTALGNLYNSPVALTSQVSGVLPAANGGTATSTAATSNGQFLGWTNATYGPWTFVAGSNMTITTTTPGQIIFASSGGGFTSDNGLIYNATSTDLVGIGTITPTTTLFIQGKSGVNPFAIASSTGTALLTVNQIGSTTLSSLGSGNVRAASGSLYIGPVSLTADVSGVLPVANGGTNSSTLGSTLVGFVANDTNIQGSIANNTLTLAWAGQLSVARGGTGTSTLPTVQGQLLAADSTGTKYGPTNLVAGSNITITTTTPGQITITGSAGGSGNSAWTIATGFIYNATSTDAVLIGTTTPSAQLFVASASTTRTTLAVQATSSQTSALFDLWSSTGTSLFSVTAGNVIIATTTAGNLIGTGNGKELVSVGIATGTTGTDFNIATTTKLITFNLPTASASVRGLLTSADWTTFNNKQAALTNPDTGTGTNGQAAYFTGSTALASAASLLNNGTVVGINASSSTISLNIQGTTTLDPFNVASSSGTSILRVSALGRVGVGSSSPNSVVVIQGTAGQTIPLLTIASSSNTSLVTVSINSTIKDVLDVNTTTPLTTQAIAFIQGTAGDATSILGIATSTGQMMFQIKANGHITASGTPPTLTSCGTSPSASGTDNAFEIQVGSVSATGCTATFSQPFISKPVCTVTNQSMSVVNAMSYTVSTTSTIVTQTGLTSAILDVICIGKEN